MKFRTYGYLTPDYIPGKIIVTIKTILDSLRLIIQQPSRQSVRFAMLMFKLKPFYTMVTNKNLITLYELVRQMNQCGLPGDIVECGVWNGGSAAIMGLSNKLHPLKEGNRHMWLFDSFEGVPRATDKDGTLERARHFEGWNKGNITRVRGIFKKLNISLENIKIVPGWFNVTLPRAEVKEIAILHIDADWYESVKLVLDVLYNRVVPGGFIILNDYNTWKGCNLAVEEFFKEHHLQNIAIVEVEPTTGAYFQKPEMEAV
jgi:O-methyltransferase